MKKLLNSKLLGSLMVGIMAWIGAAAGSVMNHSATLREIAAQEVVEQFSDAAVQYITAIVESTSPKNEAVESLTISKATMMLYGTENLVRSLSIFEKQNCSDLTTKWCRNEWKKLLSEIKKEVSGVSYENIESDIGIILLREGGQHQ